VSSTNPTLGLRFRPVADLMMRASYGTGFLPPNVGQLIRNLPGGPGSVGSVNDPRRNNEVVFPDGILGGGNPDLTPEKSKSWSAGVVLTPRFAAGLRLSVDYVWIEKTNNIANLGPQEVVDNENVLPSRVTRGPAPPGGGVGPITFVDASPANISQARVEAYDLSIDYRLETARRGSLDFYALATRQTHYKTQLVPTAPVVENVGISFFGTLGPLAFKGNAGMTWKDAPWTVGWIAYYFDSYLVGDPTNPSFARAILNQGNGGRVSSQVYHDAFARYRFGAAHGTGSAVDWLQNCEIQLGIKNLFNTKPPFDAGRGPVYYSPFGDPRLASYELSLRKSW